MTERILIVILIHSGLRPYHVWMKFHSPTMDFKKKHQREFSLHELLGVMYSDLTLNCSNDMQCRDPSPEI